MNEREPVIITVQFPSGRQRAIRMTDGDHVRVWIEGDTTHIEQTVETE